MILVFVFFSLLILFFVMFIILLLSSIKIKVENFKIENLKNNQRYKIYLQIYFLNRIKIFSYKIDSNKIRNISLKRRFKGIDYKKIKEYLPQSKYVLKSLKLLKPKIELFNLNANIGLEEATLTSYAIAIISIILSIILPKYAKNNKNIKYVLKPIYNRNILNITYESIVSLKVVHIIGMLFYLLKKGRDKYGRTSNRRAYDYSYEFN